MEQGGCVELPKTSPQLAEKLSGKNLRFFRACARKKGPLRGSSRGPTESSAFFGRGHVSTGSSSLFRWEETRAKLPKVDPRHGVFPPEQRRGTRKSSLDGIGIISCLL